MEMIKKSLCSAAVIIMAGYFLPQGMVHAVGPAKQAIKKSPPAKESNVKLIRKFIRDKKEKVFILNTGAVLSNRLSEQYEILAPVELKPDLTGGPQGFGSLEGGYTRKVALPNFWPERSMMEEGVNKPRTREIIDVTPDGEYLSLRFFKERDDAPPCNDPCPHDQFQSKYAIVRSDGSEVWSTKYENRYENESMFLFSAKNLIVDYGLYQGLALYNMKGERTGYVGRGFGPKIEFSENGQYVLVVHDGDSLKDTLALFTSNAKKLWSTTIKEENPARFRSRGPTARIFSMAISPDGEAIVAAADSFVYFFNKKGEMVSKLNCHNCTDISFFGNRRALIVKGQAILYDLVNNKEIWRTHPSRYGLTGKSFTVADITSDGKFMAFGCFNKRKQKDGAMAGKNFAMILDEQGKLKWRVPLREGRVREVRFVDNDSKLAVDTGIIYIFDVSEVVGGGGGGNNDEKNISIIDFILIIGIVAALAVNAVNPVSADEGTVAKKPWGVKTYGGSLSVR